MAEIAHLTVEEGLDKGKNIHVPPEGARLGRSSKNDIVLIDPALSRHHCRLFFKPGEGLWVTDLGSANQCLVNNKPIQEAALRVGDVLIVGDTTMRVLDNGLPQPEKNSKDPERARPAIPHSAAPVDLGLDRKAAAPRKLGVGPIAMVAAAAAIVVALALAPKLMARKSAKPAAMEKAVLPATLEIDYEKVEATCSNIFCYRLQIGRDNAIALQIDDIANNRHVRTPEKKVDENLIKSLARTALDSGFFSLSDEYRGIQPDVLEQWDLSITAGAKTHRTMVVNRVLPEPFDNLAKALEEFAKNETGTWAAQYQPDKLIEMATTAFLQGKKLYDEREVKHDNLANSITSFQEAEGYLETVDPKPDFYPEILSSIKDEKAELQTKYDDQNFQVERAIRLKEWEKAAAALRVVCEMIPDRSDQRNQEARRKLLDVERRLETRK